MMLDKKAQVEVQFNWIFVLIVGAILLTFFVVIVTKQRGAAETVLSSDVLNEMKKLISGVAVSEGKTFLIELPNVPVVYNCDEVCACLVTIKGTGLGGISIRENPVFAPSSLRGQKVMMWSQEFNVPYRATNFFYMTSPQLRYLIEETELGESIYDGLPRKLMIEGGLEQPAFTKELFDSINGIKNLNNYKVKLIFTDTEPEVPPALRIMPDVDVSAIKVDDTEITFYQKQGNSFNDEGTTKYLESSSLYGAIFAEDLVTYECMMDNAFRTYNIVTQVYMNRSSILSSEYEENPECRIYYDSFYLDNIIGATENGFKNADFGLLEESIPGLKSQNEGALLFSCAPIY